MRKKNQKFGQNLNPKKTALAQKIRKKNEKFGLKFNRKKTAFAKNQ
jgi:hypothetical protein